MKRARRVLEVARKRSKHARKPHRTCIAPGCENKAFAKELCRLHYGRMYRHGRLGLTRPRRTGPPVNDLVRTVEHTKRRLSVATEAYDAACDLQARLRFRREIDAIQETLDQATRNLLEGRATLARERVPEQLERTRA